LQILEDGILTDAQGRRVDFRNTVIIMTSNIGARLITEKHSMGFASVSDGEADQSRIRDNVMGELKRAFRPEFLNRVDDIIVFRQLTEPDIQEIARRMMRQLDKRLADMDMKLEVRPAAVVEIAKEGFDPVYGARPLRRAIQPKLKTLWLSSCSKGASRPAIPSLSTVKTVSSPLPPERQNKPRQKHKKLPCGSHRRGVLTFVIYDICRRMKSASHGRPVRAA